jgi:transcriptional regulator with XRE-family HTH domain
MVSRRGPVDEDADEYLTLGRALRALRNRAGLTQEELATRVDIGATYVSQVENGHRGVRWHTLRRLLGAIGADLHQLADAIATVDKQGGGAPGRTK